MTNYEQARERYKEELALLSLLDPAMHDRLASAVSDMLIAIKED